MDLLEQSKNLKLDVDVLLKAQTLLKEKTSSWIVVSGKLASGKDTIGPLVQPALGYTNCVRLGFGDTIRVEANQAIKILTAREESDDFLAGEISEKMNLKLKYAKKLVTMLRDLVKEPDNNVTAFTRTDLMRDVLINFGSEWRLEDDPAYWARQLGALSLQNISNGNNVYLTGGRYLPDVEVAQDLGAKIIRIDVTEEVQAARLWERDGLLPDKSVINHPSETALDNWPRFDVRVDNNGTVEEGLNKVLEKMKELS